MKIKDIKEKISKRKLKITPLIIALVFALSTLIPAVPSEAKEIPIYAKQLNSGDIFTAKWFEWGMSGGKYKARSFGINVLSGNSIHLFAFGANSSDTSYVSGFYFVSETPFSLSYGNKSGFYSDFDSVPDVSEFSSSVDVEDYTTCGEHKLYVWSATSSSSAGSSVNTDYASLVQNINVPYVRYPWEEYGYYKTSRMSTYVGSLYSNNMQIGTETIETNYAGSSSENIENVLGVLMNPYTGGNDGDEWTFLWKWTPPNDSDLIMEIMADVEYVDNLGDSLLTAVKNSWSTASVSLYEYEDGLLGSNGHLRFSYDYIKEKLSEELGEDIGFFGKVRLKNVYFRYARFNEESNSVEYGNYTTFTPTYRSYMDTEPKVGTVTYPTGQFHSGVTESYDPKTDTIPETYIKVQDPSEGVNSADDLFGAVRSYLNSGKGFIGDFPSLMGDIFQNIPPQITALITIGLGLLIVLRLFGR